MFSSVFMLFHKNIPGEGGGGQNKQNFVVLASEPVGGRSRATELACFNVFVC